MKDTQLDYEDLSIWDINSILNYIKNHFIQFFLLILVFVIIYIVDHISNVNAMIFSSPSAIPGISAQQSKTQINLKIAKKSKSYKK
jgi:hypothetical protein